ncbi:MAG: response regulator [bacterium]
MNYKDWVCIIDDERYFLEGFTRLLEWKGYRVRAYMSAEQAIEDILFGDISVVVTDVMLPGMTGLELIAKMRKVGCKVPVLLMSAHPDKDVMDLAKELGVVEFLRKPFRPYEIFIALDKAFMNGKKSTGYDHHIIPQNKRARVNLFG